MFTTAILCSAQVDFVISTQDSLHAYSSLHVAHEILLVVEQRGRHLCCIAMNDAPAL